MKKCKKVFLTQKLICLLLIFFSKNIYASNYEKMNKKETKEWKKRKKAMTLDQFREIIEENHHLKTKLLDLKSDQSQSEEDNEITINQDSQTKKEYETLKKFSQEFDTLKNKGMIFFVENQSATKEKNNEQENEETKEITQAHRFKNIENIEKILIQNLQHNHSKKYSLLTESDQNKKKTGQLSRSPSSLMAILQEVQERKEVKAIHQGVVFTVQIGAYKQKDLTKILQEDANYANNKANFQHTKEDNFNKYTIFYFKKYANANKFKKEIRSMGVKDAWIVPLKNGKRVPLKEVLSTVIQNK